MTIISNLRAFFGAGGAGAADAARVAAPAAAAHAWAPVGSRMPEHLTLALTKDSLGEVGRFFGSAEHTLTGELFHLSESGVQGAITQSAARGVHQRWLIDPEALDSVRAALPSGAVETAAYAAMPFKNHSKSFVADGDRAMMTTGAFVGKTRDRVELVATFQGDAAKAARELIEAGMEGKKGRLRDAAARAAQYGIVMNEPLAGVQHLTESVHSIINSAQRDIAISTKIYTDKGVRQAVRAAESRGVDVLFTDIRANGMHANLIVADDSLYVGTAHFSSRGMGDMTRAYRRSRESGLLVHDAARAGQMREFLDAQGMKAYTPQEFERTRVAYEKIDRYYKLQEQGADPATMAAAKQEFDEAQDAWREISAEVREARRADGITFTNPAGNR